MEANISGERPNNILLYQTARSQDELRLIDHASSSETQAGCCHFSIRGYVADVRKTNWKLCWPFTEVHSGTNLEEHEKLLPPLPVTEFTWWDCKICLKKKITTQFFVDREEVGNVASCQIQIKETGLDKNSVMPSHDSEEDLLYRETLPYRKPVKENLILTANNVCGSHLSLSTGFKVVNQYFHDHPIEEEVLTCRIGDEIQRNEQVKVTVMSSDNGVLTEQHKGDQAILQEAGLMNGSKENLVCTTLPVSKPFHGSTPKGVCSERASKEKQVHLSTETNADRHDGFFTSLYEKKWSSSGVSKCIQSDGCQDGKIEKKYEASTENDSNKSRTEIPANHMILPNKKSSHKKVQKMRTLDDILKSNVLGIAKKEFDYQRKDAARRNHNCLETDSLKQRHSIADQNEKIKSKKRKMLLEIEDEGSPLMHWLNRMPEKGKAKATKLDGKTTSFTSADFLRNRKGSIPSQKLMVTGVKICDHVERDQEIIRGKEQDNAYEGEVGKQDLVSVRKGKNLIDKVSVKDVSSRIFVSNNRTGDVLGKRPKNPKYVSHHRPDKKRRTNQKINLILRDEDRVNPSIHLTKDRDDAFRTENGSGRKTCENVSTKSTQTSGPAAMDDIPVEILKLLQENWLKRRLPTNEQSSQSSVALSDKITGIKNGKSMKVRSSARDKSVFASSKVWPVQYPEPKSSGIGFEISPLLNIQAGQCFLPKSVGSDAGLSGKAIESSSQELNNKWKNNINSSLCERSYDFNGHVEPSYIREPTNGKVTLPLIDSLGNCDPRNHKMVPQNADLYEAGQSSLFNYPLCRSSLVSPLIPYERLNSLEASYGHKFMDRVHKNILQRRKPNNMVLERHSLGTNSAFHMQKGDIITSKRSRERVHGTDKSSLGAGNDYDARKPPFNLYRNGQSSAVNLLKLMDPGIVCSAPTDMIPREFPNNYDFLYTNQQNEFQEKTNLRTNHPFINLTAKESFARSYYSETPSNFKHHVTKSGNPETFFPWSNTYSVNNCSNVHNKGMYHGESQLFPAVDRGNEKQGISGLSSQIREGESFSHRYQNLQDCYLPLSNYSSSQMDFTPSDEAMEVQKMIDVVGVCVLNRNPADFTVADDTNEYMRHLDYIEPKNTSLHENRLPLMYHNIKKQKKAMKLTALKGLLRN